MTLLFKILGLFTLCLRWLNFKNKRSSKSCPFYLSSVQGILNAILLNMADHTSNIKKCALRCYDLHKIFTSRNRLSQITYHEIEIIVASLFQLNKLEILYNFDQRHVHHYIFSAIFRIFLICFLRISLLSIFRDR